MNKRQTGAAIVEFAIAAVLFFTVLLAIFDFGRILFTWNSLAEATHLGARMSVVCKTNGSAPAPAVLANMKTIAPSLTASNVVVTWYDANGVNNSCDSSNCTGVSVSVSGVTVSTFTPVGWIGFSKLTAPGFSTYLTREIMGQDPNSPC